MRQYVSWGYVKRDNKLGEVSSSETICQLGLHRVRQYDRWGYADKWENFLTESVFIFSWDAAGFILGDTDSWKKPEVENLVWYQSCVNNKQTYLMSINFLYFFCHILCRNNCEPRSCASTVLCSTDMWCDLQSYLCWGGEEQGRCVPGTGPRNIFPESSRSTHLCTRN